MCFPSPCVLAQMSDGGYRAWKSELENKISHVEIESSTFEIKVFNGDFRMCLLLMTLKWPIVSASISTFRDSHVDRIYCKGVSNCFTVSIVTLLALGRQLSESVQKWNIEYFTFVNFFSAVHEWLKTHRSWVHMIDTQKWWTRFILFSGDSRII